MLVPPDVTGLYVIDTLLAGHWYGFFDAVHHLILPAIALALPALGQTARLTRTNLAEVDRAPYIETARAYAFREDEIALKFALRPAAIPTLTIIGLEFVALFGNAFLVETVFVWPGYGTLRCTDNPSQGFEWHCCDGACHGVAIRFCQRLSRSYCDICEPSYPSGMAIMRGPWCQSRAWYRFSRNRLSVVGLTVVVAVVLMATLAPWIVPYPEHAEAFVDVENVSQPPTVNHLFGTDDVGRDVLSRVVFGYRTSLILAVVVLAIAAPLGVVFGLTAGYLGGWADTIIMRVTDVFLAVPSLVLAMAILGLFSPSLVMAMVAVSAGWWPWYTRLVYNLSRSLRTEGYVTAAQVVGASSLRIMFSEILPNCLGTVLTKITLDMGVRYPSWIKLEFPGTWGTASYSRSR